MEMRGLLGSSVFGTRLLEVAMDEEARQAINNSDASGRFMKYDMKTGDVTVLLRNLSFANGVALSKYNDFVLVAETTANQTLKYWLTGYKAGSYEVFLQLDGRPDNINRNAEGDFWIALRMAKSIKINYLGVILETLEGDEIVNPSDVTEFHHRLWIASVAIYYQSEPVIVMQRWYMYLSCLIVYCSSKHGKSE
ncbi:protein STRICTOSIDINE SYNTHASE-LIKE 10-like [Silene latifolia]|uniref:protein STRICTOSIDINE SYNTHASE-LIKE 10-like n=1 Tax=Silene latifolia TaxID=37657 RepID=UPI003D780FE6